MVINLGTIILKHTQIPKTMEIHPGMSTVQSNQHNSFHTQINIQVVIWDIIQLQLIKTKIMAIIVLRTMMYTSIARQTILMKNSRKMRNAPILI